MEKFESCPRCDSKKVKTMGPVFWFLVMVVSGSCLFWIGLLIWPFMVLAAVLVLGSPVAFFMPKTNQCKECGYTWKMKMNKRR